MAKGSKRYVSVVISLIMLAVVIAGCSGNNAPQSSPSSSPAGSPAAPSDSGAESPSASTGSEPKGIVLDPNKKVKLRYYTSSGYDKVEFDAAYPDWQKKYPNIEVELLLVSGDDYATKIKMAMIAGEQMDIIETGTNALDRTGPDNLYLPLDDFIARDGWDLQKEYGDYPQQLMVDGKLYGIPRAVAPEGIWYNKKHFEEAGIPDPSSGDWTWEEFFQIAKQLSQFDQSGKNTRFGVMFSNFWTDNLARTATNLALYGDWEMVNEDGSFNADWTKLKQAVTWLYNAVYTDKSMASIPELQSRNIHYLNDFYKGTHTLLIGGRNGALFQDLAVEYGQLSTEDDDAGYHSLAPMPRWDANSPKKLSIEELNAVSLSKSTKNPDEAYMFIKWYSTLSVELASKVAHRIPASKLLDQKVLLENWRNYNNKDGKLVLGKQRDDLYGRMLDPEIKPIFKKNSIKYTFAGKMMLELEKQLSLLFANETTVDDAIENAKVAAFKVYEAESGK